MPRGRPAESFKRWLMRKREEVRKQAEERTKLLPEGLQEEILAACAAERERLMARIEEIDSSIETLEDRLTDAKAKMRDAAIVRKPAARRRVTADGRVKRVEPRTATVKGQAAIEAGRAVRGIETHLDAFREEKRGRRRQLREVARVEMAAEAGVVTALLHITRRWRAHVDVTGLRPRVPMGRSYTDRFGNELPEEALGPDGEPLETPDLAEARANASGSLIAEV